MSWRPPKHLQIPAEKLGYDTTVKVRVRGDQQDVAEDMARSILNVILECREAGRPATLILPVGPVDQFPILAQLINEQRVDWRDVTIINMDEYLDDKDQLLPIDHPLSFRGFMNRKFYDLVNEPLAPRFENRVFPDPENCAAIGKLIEARGGVDACFGGIGINGHIAFNEPEPFEAMSVSWFAERPTRKLDLAAATRTINSVTVGGDIGLIPQRAVTVGMKEILGSRKLRFYCNRPWQRCIVRHLLHGSITAACPASLLRLHPDAELTLASYVAEPPDIQLR